MLYDSDLASIHVDGYGFHWQRAAPTLLQLFVEMGVPTGGRVLDLGCGGGQWLAKLAEVGYSPVGIDVSEQMLRIAEQRASNAELLCGSFADTTIPQCDAATSLGEPLCYLNSKAAVKRTFRKVFAALRPGGVFVFDVRHPAIRPVAEVSHFKSADDWFCHARICEDHRQGRLTRTITTFRKIEDGAYRRAEEIHRLMTLSRDEVTSWLRQVGFRVRTKRGYGEYRLCPRQSVFVCRKPLRPISAP